ncbi:B12-binding domain-containing radical SAM protein [Wukongibacter sp. M2B1]|uniref:B12-binding domain-containing radical SAM protein n=1 Tax=Wukongibacter sp. M2B1 TaxID=3088895 RepID=UPI003D7932D7
MKKILIMAPKMNGPGNERKFNSQWPLWLEKEVKNNLWNLVTPALLTLASLTDRSKYSIELIDEEFQNVDINTDYDIVAMYTITPNVKRAYDWAKYFRAKGSWVVLGGVHASLIPTEAREFADTVLVGEGEYIWPQFLKDFEKGKAQNLYMQSIGRVKIEDSPLPAFDLIPESARKIVPIQTARGCPHGCRFCNVKSLYGDGYRSKSIERIDLEIKKAMELCRGSTLYFTDDNLFCKKERAKKLLHVVRDYKVRWYTNSDLSFGMDEKFLKLAYKSGCRQVLIGFESVTAKNLRGIDQSNFKMRHIPLYHEVIERIQSNGIGVVGSFIVGLDGDDHGVFETLAEFIFRTKLYGVSITINTPYPGTESFKAMSSANRILTYDWDQYTIFQPVIKSTKMSNEELNESYINLLKKINSPEYTAQKLQYFKENIKNINIKEKIKWE